jgi:glycosyltransferase involved in cell wall biosynthesis
MDITSQINKEIKKEPLVSILMLTYNRAAYIADAVNSVLAQSYTNFELVIIDDGSTDGTAEILSSFDDPRIAIIEYPDNKGLHARRAESLLYVQGTYVAVLDSDDLWTDTQKLATQVEYMEQSIECVVLGTFISLIDAQGAEIGHTEYCTTDTGIRSHILRRNQFTHSSVLIRTSTLGKVTGYQDTILAEDLDLFLQLGTHGTFANIPKYMTAYRIHTESFNSQRTAMARAVLGIIKKYGAQYPAYYRALIKAYVRILLNIVRYRKL